MKRICPAIIKNCLNITSRMKSTLCAILIVSCSDTSNILPLSAEEDALLEVGGTFQNQYLGSWSSGCRSIDQSNDILGGFRDLTDSITVNSVSISISLDSNGESFFQQNYYSTSDCLVLVGSLKESANYDLISEGANIYEFRLRLLSSTFSIHRSRIQAEFNKNLYCSSSSWELAKEFNINSGTCSNLWQQIYLVDGGFLSAYLGSIYYRTLCSVGLSGEKTFISGRSLLPSNSSNASCGSSLGEEFTLK